MNTSYLVIPNGNNKQSLMVHNNVPASNGTKAIQYIRNPVLVIGSRDIKVLKRNVVLRD